MFLYQKKIDRSALRQGFQIPVEFHPLLEAAAGGMPQHGETRNNNPSNIIILSPNYHRIVHKTKPEWDKTNLAFIFPND